jgi:hypothetical protein
MALLRKVRDAGARLRSHPIFGVPGNFSTRAAKAPTRYRRIRIKRLPAQLHNACRAAANASGSLQTVLSEVPGADFRSPPVTFPPGPTGFYRLPGLASAIGVVISLRKLRPSARNSEPCISTRIAVTGNRYLLFFLRNLLPRRESPRRAPRGAAGARINQFQRTDFRGLPTVSEEQ